jgi:hypothetical protein
MNVVLIGYRGTGKSTVGKIVAARLGRALVSTDAEIVKLVSQSIPENNMGGSTFVISNPRSAKSWPAGMDWLLILEVEQSFDLAMSRCSKKQEGYSG